MNKTKKTKKRETLASYKKKVSEFLAKEHEFVSYCIDHMMDLHPDDQPTYQQLADEAEELENKL